MKHISLFLYITSLLLMQAACTAAEPAATSAPPPTQVPPTAVPPTPTPLPPTDTVVPPSLTPAETETPAPILAASMEEIAGDWYAVGQDALFHRFNPDGTCYIATDRGKLDTGPDVACTCTFAGADMTMKCHESTGLPPCPGEAIYQVQLLDSGNIKFLRVRDSCGPRVKTMRLEYFPVE